jgi:hypothetical protein
VGIGPSIAERVHDALAKRLIELKGPSVLSDENPRYVRTPKDNLLPGLDFAAVAGDLQRGGGGEIKPKQGLCKFCATYSSSALAVNTFGPFRTRPNLLLLAGKDGFEETVFEKPLSTGLRGISPNLDFFARSSGLVVAVESKLSEILRPKKAKFTESYREAVRADAEPAWAAMYERLKDDPCHFTHVDSAQLVKHYLGIRHALAEKKAPKVLVYVYWEPMNAEDFDAYRAHRSEIREFSGEVKDSEIRFEAITYSELWDSWDSTPNWVGTAQHIENLRERYDLEI